MIPGGTPHPKKIKSKVEMVTLYLERHKNYFTEQG